MNREEKPSKETIDQWHDDPANWKLGIFYYNKQDHRIFPSKRIKGFGWTINFANPASIFTYLGATVLILVLVYIFSKNR